MGFDILDSVWFFVKCCRWELRIPRKHRFCDIYALNHVEFMSDFMESNVFRIIEIEGGPVDSIFTHPSRIWYAVRFAYYPNPHFGGSC